MAFIVANRAFALIPPFQAVPPLQGLMKIPRLTVCRSAPI